MIRRFRRAVLFVCENPLLLRIETGRNDDRTKEGYNPEKNPTKSVRPNAARMKSVSRNSDKEKFLSTRELKKGKTKVTRRNAQNIANRLTNIDSHRN
jgi:hypothetical protein